MHGRQSQPRAAGGSLHRWKRRKISSPAQVWRAGVQAVVAYPAAAHALLSRPLPERSRRSGSADQPVPRRGIECRHQSCWNRMIQDQRRTVPARLAPLELRRLLPCWRELGFLESLPVGQQLLEALHGSLPPRIVKGAETAEVFR